MGRVPELWFGSGQVQRVPELVRRFGARQVLLLTGGESLRESRTWAELLSALARDCDVTDFRVDHEPSPQVVDDIVRAVRTWNPQVVVAIGGGSVVDAGKAVSAMLCEEGGVADYLEGVGTRLPCGAKVPLIAVPTTAGTGSEATKNAVISRPGPQGFKRSLRHDNYVPDVAVLDPELARSCPPAVTAASGMDAVTQLLEAFVSTGGNPMTDALCRSGLRAAAGALPGAVERAADLDARSGMGYAAYLSGIGLANAGLGVVHGLASPVGARFGAPHGAVCGALVAPATRVVLERLQGSSEAESAVALGKYAEAGYLLSRRPAEDVEHGCAALVETLELWTDMFGIESLAEMGMDEDAVSAVSAEAGVKNTPVELSRGDIETILRRALYGRRRTGDEA